MQKTDHPLGRNGNSNGIPIVISKELKAFTYAYKKKKDACEEDAKCDAHFC